MATSASTTPLSHILSKPTSPNPSSSSKPHYQHLPLESSNPISSNSSIKVSLSTDFYPKQTRKQFVSGRRELLGGVALVSVLLKDPLISEAREIEVGSYLQPSPLDPAFVVFKATAKDTPALRAGIVNFSLIGDL
ncbi:hypothetical protein GIB67_016924 [Kingdonia uniflora]|uniref:Uncharacterized protein n=1 Tax=Kingdonia uniflora TaxID=39325 RepID=A0A7J7M3G6_9MAGN|nr:hypothetical protein GIB67_016924 [Kingdonia uniflora]